MGIFIEHQPGASHWCCVSKTTLSCSLELTGSSITTSYRPLVLFQRGSRIQYFFLISLTQSSEADNIIIHILQLRKCKLREVKYFAPGLRANSGKTRVPTLVGYTPRGTCDLSVVVSFTV